MEIGIYREIPCSCLLEKEGVRTSLNYPPIINEDLILDGTFLTFTYLHFLKCPQERIFIGKGWHLSQSRPMKVVGIW